MTFEVLISCMNQNDISIVSKANLKKNVIIINQANFEKVFEDSDKNIKMYSTIERGLSKSRNLAIEKSNADICLISDDDEVFVDDLEHLVLDSYNKYNYDIIVFDLSNYHKKITRKPHILKRLELLKISSVQISFKRSSVYGIVNFDENLGAGTYNGFGEENNFLLRAYKKGLKIFYLPIDIGVLETSNSTWFKGYNSEYFFKRGKISRYNLGLVTSIFYSVYFVLTKRKLYSKSIGFLKALKYSVKGCFAKNISVKLED